MSQSNPDIDVCLAINACRKADPRALLKSLGPDYPSPVFDQENSQALLTLSIQANNAECVAILLKAGAPLNLLGPHPMVAAAHAGSSAICSMLLAAGADPEGGGELPSPLMISTLNRAADICKALIAAGARVDACSTTPPSLSNGYRKGRQAIHYAAQFASHESLRALLLAGADPLALDGDGDSAKTLSLKSTKPNAKLCFQLINSFLEQRELSATADPACALKRPGSL